MKSKQMIAAIKKVATNKAAVPACQSAFFDGNRISVYDLDVYLSIPFKSNHKACIDALRLCTIWETIGQAQDITESTESQVLFVDGKRRFKVANNDYEPFNDLTKGYESMLLIGSIDCDDIQQIKKASSYISGDDLRPVMMAVALIDNCIVSTDSHRMFFSKPKDTLPKEQALLSKKTIDLLHILEPAHWTIYRNDAGGIVLSNDEGVLIYDRHNTRGNYPNWQAVIPKADDQPIRVSFLGKDVRDCIKVGQKFANQTTRQVKFRFAKNASTAHFEDLDYDGEYSQEIPNCTFECKDGSCEDFTIDINYNFLSEILKDCEDKVNIRMSAPNRAMVINESFLLIPIILNN